MKKVLLIAGLFAAGAGLYVYSTYKLDQAPACTQGVPGYDCIEGRLCDGLVCNGKCITSFNDCAQCGDDWWICEVSLAQ